MAERVFLHVGAPKTGTTYLQQMLWGNREALKDAGILLPGSRKAHYQAMGDLRRSIWYEPDAWWTWDRLAAKAEAWHGTVVISEEMLGAATQEQAARAIESLRPAEVHVVVAGRDLARTIPSSWQQAIRARGLGSFSNYVAALKSGRYQPFWEHQTPLPILRRWADGLPEQRRHLVTVPPSGADPDLLWSRFAGVVGIPDGVCQQKPSHGNASLGAAETELLRRVNVALGDTYPLRAPYMRVVHRHLVNPILKRRTRGDRFGTPAELADWVRRTGERMAEEARAYPCQIAGDADDLIPAELRSATAPDDLDDAVLLEVAVDTIVQMLRRTDSLSAKPNGSDGAMSTKMRKLTLDTRRRIGQGADRLRRLGK